MKVFLKKLVIFIFPAVLVPILLNFAVPINFWSFRSWEALAKFDKNASVGPFYPNQTLEMAEKGDLAHSTNYAIIKNTIWRTDSLGFRNNEVPRQIDILFIGDSFVAGTSLSQDQTISSQVEQISGKKTYQMAPGTIESFTELLQLGLIPKPKVVILSVVERNIPLLKPIQEKPPETWKKILAQNAFLGTTTMYIDRLSKNSAQKKLNALISEDRAVSHQSPVDPKFFFYEGFSAKIKYDDAKVNANTDTIAAYKAYFNRMDIDFVFLPMPNKESVYYEFVPYEKQPDFLYALDKSLVEKKIKTVNTLALYNKNKPTKLLYFPDDSHWTPEASKLTAEALVKYFSESK